MRHKYFFIPEIGGSEGFEKYSFSDFRIVLIPGKGSNIWHITLGDFFSQKPYVSLVSATLWIMETVQKSSLGNLDEVLKDLNRAVFQTEPKLVIK